jgi:iron-sulfur cluster repair protein YtfE (RIC family)
MATKEKVERIKVQLKEILEKEEAVFPLLREDEKEDFTYMIEVIKNRLSHPDLDKVLEKAPDDFMDECIELADFMLAHMSVYLKRSST